MHIEGSPPVNGTRGGSRAKCFHLPALLGLALAFAALLTSAAAAAAPPVVLAAASLQESLTAAAAAWSAKRRRRPLLSFASSAALARQIENGAPADMFISADEQWMDYLEQRHLIRQGTRSTFLGNRLVIIAPASTKPRISLADPRSILVALGDGPLALADPDSVPAGRYAKAALEHFRLWPALRGRIAAADNVRAALLFVERGDARLGIVYDTDARATTKVKVVARLPDSSHQPISYPLALTASSRNPEALAFRQFLLSNEGRSIFRRYGFYIL